MTSSNCGDHSRQRVASPPGQYARAYAHRARRERRLYGAVPASLISVLAGPTRPARPLGVFPSAVYLQLTDVTHGRVVALVTADAVRLPNAVVLDEVSADRPFAELRSTDNAALGNQQLWMGPLRIDVARVWTPQRPHPNPPVPRLQTNLSVLQRCLSEHARQAALQHTPPAVEVALVLAHATATKNLDLATTTATRMLGRGPGLTPSGDDYLAGFLTTLALQAEPTRADFTARLGDHIVTTAGTATTALSAALLQHAAHGEAPSEVSDVLDALSGHDDPLEEAIHRLLAVGHSSGYQLARGVWAATHTQLSPCRRAESMSRSSREITSS